MAAQILADNNVLKATSAEGNKGGRTTAEIFEELLTKNTKLPIGKFSMKTDFLVPETLTFV